MFFREVWDPWLIISQIITFLCSFEIVLGIWFYVFDSMCGERVTIDQFFDSYFVNIHSSLGIATIVAYLFTAVVCGMLLVLIVERSKKCLDFAFTIYLIHFATSVLHFGFPTSWTWWILVISSLTITAVLGEYLCMQRELKEIRLTPGRSTNDEVV
eukprot:TRINITY_DN4981_c0_g1_i1.p1 TRINITY_DN4981_c0_g1~~TRINITY_DN4981_c0_g1_i1.p1  ORF type:complete len:156 (+),score=32.28 TRINITY_DN4981_c0_g1_i1:414-881(+)